MYVIWGDLSWATFLAPLYGLLLEKAAPTSDMGLVSRVAPVHTAKRTRDEGGPFELVNQVSDSSPRKLLWSKATVVLCQEDARASCCMRDEGRPFGVAL
jgi:hypothetical protein